MIFQGRDGELRVIERGDYPGSSIRKGATYYLEVLFCGMDFSAPLGRPKIEERPVLNRNVFDSDTHYVKGTDEGKLTPMTLTFSGQIDDKNYHKTLSDWFSGATQVHCTAASGLTTLLSWNGSTLIGLGGGVSIPAFADSTKLSYRVEVLWDSTAGNDYGLLFDEVYFPPDQQTITEAEDSITISCNGMVYGGVSRISAFTAGGTAVVTD